MTVPAYKDEGGRGTWYASFRYTDWTGKRRTHKKRGFERKKDAQDYEREFLLKATRNPDMTFASLVELYCKDKDNRLRESTMGTKQNIIDIHLLPYFGKLQLGEISPATVRDWQNTMLAKIKPSGEPYAPTYLRSVYSQLSTILNYAVRFYGLTANPCHAAGTIGKKKAPTMQFWTVDEFNAAMEQVASESKRIAFKMLFWIGLRVGECLALTPADILPTKEARIHKTFTRSYGEDVFGPTKTENSVRLCSMPDFLYDELQSYIGKLYGIADGDRIFYFTKSTLNKELDAAAAKAGVKRIRVHDLRHSHAALLIELGYSPSMVAERLGDTIQVAMGTYAHLYPSKQAALAADLDRHENGIVREPENFAKTEI